MKIAVTGASGFIGRAVLAELSRRGIAAVACSRSGIGAHPGADHQTVALDLHEAPADAYERLGRPDTVIHLAWSGLPNYRSLHHVDSELPAHYRFLSGLVESGLQSLVVAGTCFEYGMQSGPLGEDLPTRPENPYGFAKDALRRELEFLKASRPFALTWARLFYLYGEGQAETSLLPQLRQAVARGDKAFNMSGGEQLRDYLSVEAAANLLVSLALARCDAGAVNVCSGRPVSVRRLVEGWIRDYGWAIELNLGHYPYPEYEPMAFWGERRKLDTILDGR
ncbi:MAG: NAD-dependent epimerase/dehydratase family protein [Rhodocyclaceae bacterium]|nr:NAD-dependent epimerase/dehydratase family protein [Rhodocyclaceae bacterium]